MFGFNNNKPTNTVTVTATPVVMTGGYNSTMVEINGVVIKMGQNKSQLEQLLQEGNIYSRLEGVEGIIPNVKLGEFKEEPALFMPYIEGAMDLGEFMISNLKDNLDGIKASILQTRSICRKLWGVKLHHEDLHLGNVIVSPNNGKVYIIDFGRSQFGHGTDREWADLVSQLAKLLGELDFPDRKAQQNGRKLMVWLEELNEIPLSQIIN